MTRHFFFLPDWHAAGTSRARDGALALRAAFGELEPAIEVPVDASTTVSLDQAIVARPAILRQLTRALEALDDARPEQLFSILGTCGAELAPISYLNAKFGGNLAVVWLDAHGDLNTPSSSPSNRFHGMVLRTLLGDGDPDLIALVRRPLDSTQVVLAGTRDLDDPERAEIARRVITLVPPAALADPDRLVAAVSATGCTNIYVHVDLDVLDPIEFPNVLVPAEGGISVAALNGAIASLKATFPISGLSVVEYAAAEDDRTQTVRQIIGAL